MKTILALTGTGLLTLAPSSSAQTTDWFQSCDRQTVQYMSGTSCHNIPAGITDTWFHRVFDVANVQTAAAAPIGCGPNPVPVSVFGSDQLVTEIRIGVGSSTTAAGTLTLRFSILDVSSSGGFPQDPLVAPVLGTTEIELADTAEILLSVPVDPPIRIPSGTTHVQLAVMVENGQPQGDFYWPGFNSAGEFPLQSSFVSAPDCGILVPVSYASVGFPDLHLLMELTTVSAAGTSYCGPAIANSTGMPGLLVAGGSLAVTDNDLTLFAYQLPPGRFGYFLASQVQDFVQPPGSNGFLCLGMPCARYNRPEEIFTGPSGSLDIDLTAVPLSPPVGVLPGDTWNFQCWFRDVDPGDTSNFTDAASVTFL